MRTPSGRYAKVLLVDEELGEALVQWPDQETARMRLAHLQLEAHE